MRWYESWMNDLITSIDAENIEKNVFDSYKAMHKAIKQFQDFESKPFLFTLFKKKDFNRLTWMVNPLIQIN